MGAARFCKRLDNPSHPTRQGRVGDYSHVDCLDCHGEAPILCLTICGHGGARIWGERPPNASAQVDLPSLTTTVKESVAG